MGFSPPSDRHFGASATETPLEAHPTDPRGVQTQHTLLHLSRSDLLCNSHRASLTEAQTAPLLDKPCTPFHKGEGAWSAPGVQEGGRPLHRASRVCLRVRDATGPGLLELLRADGNLF